MKITIIFSLSILILICGCQNNEQPKNSEQNIQSPDSIAIQNEQKSKEEMETIHAADSTVKAAVDSIPKLIDTQNSERVSKPNFDCNVKENRRDDGVTVRYINPSPVGSDGDIQVGLGLETNGSDYFVTMVAVYDGEAKTTTGKLLVSFTDDKSIRLPLYKTQLINLNGKSASMSTFILSNEAAKQITDGKLKYLGFEEADDVQRVITITRSETILSDDYNCLNK